MPKAQFSLSASSYFCRYYGYLAGWANARPTQNKNKTHLKNAPKNYKGFEPMKNKKKVKRCILVRITNKKVHFTKLQGLKFEPNKRGKNT